MPLIKRVIWPTNVARVPIVEEWLRDENGRLFPALMPVTDTPQDLDAFTNLTLANLISQLSSLSRHAEDLFGELITESTAILNRSVSLQGRVDKLSVKVKNLDSNVEEVSLQDIHMRKAFKSSTVFDQQVVSRDTVPLAMLEQYKSCDQPPPLQELNPYRDDGKDGLKFYTDPSYFFNLWKEEMKQETERLKHDKKKPNKPKTENSRVKKQKMRKANLIRDKQKQKVLDAGEVLVEKGQYREPPQNQIHYEQTTIVDGRPLRPNSIEIQAGQHATTGTFPRNAQNEVPYEPNYDPNYLPPAYSPDPNSTQVQNKNGMTRNVSSRPSQPPPAPPMETSSPAISREQTPTRLRGPSQGRESLPPPPLPPVDLPPPPPTPDKMPSTPPPEIEPPPPPPPPPPINGGPPVMAPTLPIVNGEFKKALRPVNTVEDKPRAAVNDARSDLLKAIRDGIKLKKVEEKPRPKDDSDPGGDVASILQRRFAFEFSDSESEQDSQESDSEDWPDQSI